MKPLEFKVSILRDTIDETLSRKKKWTAQEKLQVILYVEGFEFW